MASVLLEWSYLVSGRSLPSGPGGGDDLVVRRSRRQSQPERHPVDETARQAPLVAGAPVGECRVDDQVALPGAVGECGGESGEDRDRAGMFERAYLSPQSGQR